MKTVAFSLIDCLGFCPRNPGGLGDFVFKLRLNSDLFLQIFKASLRISQKGCALPGFLSLVNGFLLGLLALRLITYACEQVENYIRIVGSCYWDIGMGDLGFAGWGFACLVFGCGAGG